LAGEVDSALDAPRDFTRHNFFVAAVARFLLTLFPANAGETARLSDVLISRARLEWDLASRPARWCGEPSAATEEAAKRDERAIAARCMTRRQREKELGGAGVELLQRVIGL
jgi:hypothetical protein